MSKDKKKQGPPDDQVPLSAYEDDAPPPREDGRTPPPPPATSPPPARSEAVAIIPSGGAVSQSHDGDVVEMMDAPTSALVATAEAEVKAGYAMAARFPRDEVKCEVALYRKSDNPRFADKALYRYSRGGSNITGPSVVMAREMARLWGHIRYGVRILFQDDEWVHLAGWALDCQTGGARAWEDRFRKLIYRKQGGWRAPDERELRELINRRGALAYRNAVLSLMPFDVIEDMKDRCNATMIKVAKGELGKGAQDKDMTIRAVVLAYDAIGVSKEQIEKYLQMPLTSIGPEQLVTLRQVLKSIQDGVQSRYDFFEFSTVNGNTGTATGKLETEALSKSTAAPTPHPRAAGITFTEFSKVLESRQPEIIHYFEITPQQMAQVYVRMNLLSLKPGELLAIKENIENGDFSDFDAQVSAVRGTEAGS